mgnify:CR=1 FL=1
MYLYVVIMYEKENYKNSGSRARRSQKSMGRNYFRKEGDLSTKKKEEISVELLRNLLLIHPADEPKL